MSAPEGPSLADLQRRFFELVTGPEGVARALAARGLAPDTLAALVVGDQRGSAVERLDVYANMYFYRILDVLRSDYPKLVVALGDAAFHNLATAYLVAHPSRHPSLRHVGAALPGFLAGQALAVERPWLADLAALEWARVDVFDRADVPLLTRDGLAALGPEAFAALSLRLIPAHQVVLASATVAASWRAIEAGDAPPPEVPDAPRQELLVWRREVTVHHRSLEAHEGMALSLARGGTTFASLCAELGARLDSDEAAAQVAVHLLGRWLADELLAA